MNVAFVNLLRYSWFDNLTTSFINDNEYVLKTINENDRLGDRQILINAYDVRCVEEIQHYNGECVPINRIIFYDVNVKPVIVCWSFDEVTKLIYKAVALNQ